jgi:peptidoglycan hydrolase CwlO-like protein
MFKKVLIATLAVVFGLAVIKGTWLGKHLQRKATEASAWVKKQVPPEEEIKQLRADLADLTKEDNRFYDAVARLSVDVDRKEAEVKQLRATVERKTAQVQKLYAELPEGTTSVGLDGRKFTRTDLTSQALSLKNAEEALKIKERSLDAKKSLLATERKKLAELKNKRESMMTELDRLEADLAHERELQAASRSTIDDSGYRRSQEGLNSLRYRLDVMKKNRELRGEFPATDETPAASEDDVQADKFLQAKFGGKKEVVSDKK